MKLLQLNVWKGKLQYQILDFLKEYDADIVCLQEVHDLPGSSEGVFATLDEMQAASRLKHRFMSATHDFKYMNRTARYGNALLSRFPLVSKDTVFTHGSYVSDFDIPPNDINIRNFQHVTLQDSGLHIINHHGFYVHGSKAGNDETLRQMKMLADYIAKLSGPIIVCGDLNLEPSSASIHLIENQGLINLSAQHNLTSTYTEMSALDVVCDYIFVNNAVRVVSFKKLTALLSDHAALELEFAL
jgi:endonuclease/exonuclease/phosphatase family metal-dependent hydrolase